MTAPQAGPPPRTDSYAIASLVLGVLGLVFFPLVVLLGPIGLALGVQGRKRIAASDGELGGAGIARAGFVLGIINTVLGALLLVGFGICVAMLSSMGY